MRSVVRLHLSPPADNVGKKLWELQREIGARGTEKRVIYEARERKRKPESKWMMRKTGRKAKRNRSGTEGKSQNRGKQREIEAEQREDEIPERRKRK